MKIVNKRMKNNCKNYSTCLKITFVIHLLFLVCACSTTSRIQKEKITENSFIILKNKDTIYGKKIRLSRGFNKIGKVKVVKANSEKLVFGYDKVYQTHTYRKDGSFYVEEMVMLSPNDPVSYTLVDIIINTGNVKLYNHDPTNMPNILFVVSDIYYGYIRNQTEFNSLMLQLNKCTAFKEKFLKQQPEKPLAEMIRFYNINCSNR